jgi:uncharacterized protein YceK
MAVNIGVLLVALAATGCGTCANLADHSRIYGGTQLDSTSLLHACKELSHPNEPGELTPKRDAAAALGSCIDLPFSVMADTFTLPITCYHSWKDRNKQGDTSIGAETNGIVTTAAPPMAHDAIGTVKKLDGNRADTSADKAELVGPLPEPLSE